VRDRRDRNSDAVVQLLCFPASVRVVCNSWKWWFPVCLQLPNWFIPNAVQAWLSN